MDAIICVGQGPEGASFSSMIEMRFAFSLLRARSSPGVLASQLTWGILQLVPVRFDYGR